MSLNISDTIVPRSDQINSEDLLSSDRTVTITEVRRSASDEQPFEIVTAEFGPKRPFKPSKTVRRILVVLWGEDASVYVGRRMTIYRDPDVKWAGQPIGGIRVSAMSHIKKAATIALTETRGKRQTWRIDPLPDDAPPTADKKIADAIAHYRDKHGVTLAQLEAYVAAPSSDWSATDLASLRALSGELARGEKTVAGVFGEQDGAGA